MFTPEEMLHQSYYTTRTIQELAESIASYMENDALKDASTIHFLIAAAHASDICDTIQEKDVDFDLMPCEAIEKKAESAFNYWKLRGLFFREDEQGNIAGAAPVMQLGSMTAIPTSDEQMEREQDQLHKKASCFFLFYCWNLFRQKLGDAYELDFVIDTMMIPMLQSLAFSRLGITLKSKESPAVQHYFDALQFGEEVCRKDAGRIYFAMQHMLDDLGIPALQMPHPQDYDDRRFRIYEGMLLEYIPEGNETSVAIPEGVKRIKTSAFRQLAGIAAVHLPDSLEELQDGAFYAMPDLAEVHISHNFKQLYCFPFLESRIESVCEDMLIIGGWLIKCRSEAAVIQIPAHVAGICGDAFADETKAAAKEIILPPGLREINEETFRGFSALERISLPDGLQSIGMTAFSDCESLREIVMPDSVTTLGGGAFQGCEALTCVRLSDSITELSECAFVDCSSLKDLHLPAQLRSIGADGINVFAGCSSLKKIVFPEHLEYIGECAFQDCEALEEIVLPDAIRTIDNLAFAGCEKLAKVQLPAHEVEIAENAFEGTIYEAEQRG